jgi:hypothetical protein
MSDPMPARKIPEKFQVAFSFAGEQRDLVHRIAETVEARLGHSRVFFAGNSNRATGARSAHRAEAERD